VAACGKASTEVPLPCTPTPISATSSSDGPRQRPALLHELRALRSFPWKRLKDGGLCGYPPLFVRQKVFPAHWGSEPAYREGPLSVPAHGLSRGTVSLARQRNSGPIFKLQSCSLPVSDF